MRAYYLFISIIELYLAYFWASSPFFYQKILRWNLMKKLKQSRLIIGKDVWGMTYETYKR